MGRRSRSRGGGNGLSRRTFVAGGLVATGGAVLAARSGAFSQSQATREASVDAADDDAALLAIEKLDTTVSDQNDREEILEITNNTGEDVQLDVEVTIHGEGLEDPDEFDDFLSAEGTTTYAVACEPGSGSGTTNVAVEVLSAAGDSTTISGMSETYEITRDCSGPGDPGEPGERPPSDEVYEIFQENWHDDREYVFAIREDNDDVWEADWDFGDGTTASGHWIEHTYDEDGTYEITLTAVIGGEEYTYTESLEVET